jgi:hypothetical protein
MSEMVERVARAIYAAGKDDYAWPWDELNETRKEGVRDVARAAIAAMREPTEAMLQAGSDIAHVVTLDDWEYMIDEALEPAGAEAPAE